MERPTFQKAIDSAKSRAREAVGGLALLTLAAVACKGGEGQGVETTPTQPANSPVATETIAPTVTPQPTEAPTVVPTEAPVETPATFEELLDAFRVAYSKLDSATVANLPTNQTQAYVEDLLYGCSEGRGGWPPDHPNYGYGMISNCTMIPQEINGIPGREDSLEFSGAVEKLGSFTLFKMDELYAAGKFVKEENGQFVSINEAEFNEYRAEVSVYFPK